MCELGLFKQNMTQNQSNPEMENIVITRDGIEKILNNLNPNKASGPDKISPRLMQTLSTEIAPFLTKIFKASLEVGISPNDWKSAIVAPVYKKGP